MTIRDYTMLSGQFFTDQDVDAAAKTAVLGETVVQNLFGDTDPTGQVARAPRRRAATPRRAPPGPRANGSTNPSL